MKFVREETTNLDENVKKTLNTIEKNSDESKAMSIAALLIAIGASAAASSSRTEIGKTFEILKFFQLTEIFYNLGKMNTKYGIKLKALFDLIRALRFPDFDAPRKMTIFDDKEDFISYRKGDRKRTIFDNVETFIIDGSNVIIFPLLMIIALVFYISIIVIGGKHFLTKITGKIKNILIGMTIMKFQMIAAVQIGSEYKNNDRYSGSKWSYWLAISFIIVATIDIIWVFNILGIERREEDLEKMDPVDLDIFNSHVELFKKRSKELGTRLFLYQKMKYIIIQFMIASLQMLGKAQLILVLITQTTFFVYFWRETKKRARFTYRIVYFKNLFEELTIFIVLITFLIFNLTEKTSFIETVWFDILEWICLILILIAMITQLVATILTVIFNLKGLIKKKLEEKKKAEERKDRELFTEQTESERLPDKISKYSKKTLNGGKKHILNELENDGDEENVVFSKKSISRALDKHRGDEKVKLFSMDKEDKGY